MKGASSGSASSFVPMNASLWGFDGEVLGAGGESLRVDGAGGEVDGCGLRLWGWGVGGLGEVEGVGRLGCVECDFGPAVPGFACGGGDVCAVGVDCGLQVA